MDDLSINRDQHTGAFGDGAFKGMTKFVEVRPSSHIFKGDIRAVDDIENASNLFSIFWEVFIDGISHPDVGTGSELSEGRLVVEGKDRSKGLIISVGLDNFFSRWLPSDPGRVIKIYIDGGYCPIGIKQGEQIE